MSNERYEMKNPGNTALDSKLLYVTYSKFENDWSSLLHIHQFTELFYVIGGSGLFQVDNVVYPIGRNDFVIVNSGTAHTEKSTGNVPLEYISVGVENISFSFEGNKEHLIFHCDSKQQDLLFYMNTMLLELENNEKESDRICQDLLEVLIIKLIRRTNFAFEVSPATRINRECVKLKRYMDSNYTTEITLDKLAGISHLNKYYLVHVFNKYCGCSPINYLCKVRIKASQELLRSTDYSISDIAQCTGFSSQSYFAQCFLKYAGVSASEYRKTQ